MEPDGRKNESHFFDKFLHCGEYPDDPEEFRRHCGLNNKLETVNNVLIIAATIWVLVFNHTLVVPFIFDDFHDRSLTMIIVPALINVIILLVVAVAFIKRRDIAACLDKRFPDKHIPESDVVQ